MTYSRNRLSTLAYANGFTLWHYKGCDTIRHLQDCKALRRYFKPARPLLRDGDLILMSNCAQSILKVSNPQSTDTDFALTSLATLPAPANDMDDQS